MGVRSHAFFRVIAGQGCLIHGQILASYVLIFTLSYNLATQYLIQIDLLVYRITYELEIVFPREYIFATIFKSNQFMSKRKKTGKNLKIA